MGLYYRNNKIEGAGFPGLGLQAFCFCLSGNPH
jgi:hypothetical protein